ncbi:MAG: hypothetical protein KY393_00845 [Actinobacteria bacterium]|nr:hypothetical protein [Actinomycetota bacterium]
MNPTGRWLKTLVLAAALAIAASACGNDRETDPAGSDGGGDTAELEDVSADFELGEIVTADALDRPEAVAKVHGEGPKVVALLNRLYDAAFLDPKLWEEGKHSAMLKLFTEQARNQLTQDLESLALGEQAPQFERVTPDKQAATKVTFFVSEDMGTPIGLVSVVFSATGTPVDEELDPLTIAQTANYWLTFDNGYKISAYSAELEIDEVEE